MGRIRLIIIVTYMLSGWTAWGQSVSHLSPRAGNPIIPGYFADPTVRKFGDTYYIYATTDGNGFGYGPPQVWTSKDFVHWGIQVMNWPHTPIYWAPDVNQAADGNYYLYYCQPVEIYGARSKSPTGPWTPLLSDGKPVVRNHFVPNVITLDGQTFKDDDGKMYLFWGTWGIYPKSGCGMGLLNPDMKSFAKTGIIPNTLAKDFFEAPFMFKRKGIYYLMYSAEHCEDASYKVHYVMSKTGPMGPFTYGKNSPVLVTNTDETVHGPGHNSVLQEGGDFYIVYHRHNNPHNQGGFHRQIAADKLEFDEEGNILPVTATHCGIGFLGKNAIPYPDLAFGKTVTASSVYSPDFQAAYAVDQNNGTLWKAADNMHEAWLQVDLGKKEMVRSVLTQFEYATWFYQYQILASLDGKKWEVFVDRSNNRRFGSPMKDYGSVQARFIRVVMGNTQVPGLNKAIWNLQVFSEPEVGDDLGVESEEQMAAEQTTPQGLLVDLEAHDLPVGSLVKEWVNQGALGGTLVAQGKLAPYVVQLAGRKALRFDGQQQLLSSFNLPSTIQGNSSFTLGLWVLNEEIAKRETLVNWANGDQNLMFASLGYGSDRQEGAILHGGWGNMSFRSLPEAGRWHHIALTFDGTTEKLYVDGMLERSEENRMLFLKEVNKLLIGNDRSGRYFFSGALSDLKLFDRAFSASEIIHWFQEKEVNPYAVYVDPASWSFGKYTAFSNQGYLLGKWIHEQALEVGDVSGVMAVKLPKGSKMEFDGAIQQELDQLPLQTWIAYVYPEDNVEGLKKGTWQQVVYEKQKGQHGQASTCLLDRPWSTEVAIAGLYVFDRRLSEAEIKQMDTQWKAQHRIEWPDSKALIFSKRTQAISPTALYLELDSGIATHAYRVQFFLNQASLDGWSDLPRKAVFGLESGKSYQVQFKLADRFGNVSPGSEGLSLQTDSVRFREQTDFFDREEDLLTQKGGLWDGLLSDSPDSLEVGTKSGSLKLASANSEWDGRGKKGPFLFREVKGDFLAEVKVGDMSGLAHRRPIGGNDVGLMWREISDSSEQRESFLQNGILLGWGVGNIVSQVRQGRRMQQPLNNGWDFYPYLQIQRTGDLLFLRGSKDGKAWVDLPGSPYIKPSSPGKKAQVGLYQARYGDNQGFGSFESFRLYQLNR